MQYALSVTLCDGFSLSIASFASEPWKYCPAGIFAVRSGQVGSSGAALGAGATLETSGALGFAIDVAPARSLCPPPRSTKAAAATPSTATPAPTKPSLDLPSAG